MKSFMKTVSNAIFVAILIIGACITIGFWARVIGTIVSFGYGIATKLGL